MRVVTLRVTYSIGENAFGQYALDTNSLHFFSILNFVASLRVTYLLNKNTLDNPFPKFLTYEDVVLVARLGRA